MALAARRGRPSAETTQQRMVHLLEVARAIFVRRGYRATTMDEIAAAAGLTKRTVYAWHGDKDALFHACVRAGAERFPVLKLDDETGIADALQRFVEDLHAELVAEDSLGMGILFLREAQDFPELAEAVGRGFFEYLVDPLAETLRAHGLEKRGSKERTVLFVSMALARLHNFLLVGIPLPSPQEAAEHARLCVDIFLQGSN